MRGESMERGYTLDELWAATHRRARVGLLAFGGVVILGAILVASLPSEYRAEATIIVEPYRPHAEMVVSSVTTLMEDRLRIARQQLLSRTVLEKVVVEQNLYPEMRAKLGVEAAIDQLRRHVEVHPDGETAVVVAFRTADKDKAAPVVQAIADGFVRANADLRTGQARRVLDIIQDELASVSKQVEGAEARLRSFRTAHDGELPEQLESNLHEADRMTHLLDGTQGYMHTLDTRLAAMPLTPTSPEVERIAAVESDLVRQLSHAQSMFTPDHPEPQRLARELQNMREQKAKAIDRLRDQRAEREQVRREMARAKADASAIEAGIKTVRARAEAAAMWGTDLTVMERDRDMLRDKYKSLMSRKVEGEVSLNLEEKSAPLATNVVDPPSVPGAPAAPDRMKLMLVVLALAAGMAVGVGAFLEAKDVSVRTPAQARQQLGVPLLAVVPSLRANKR
jgi:succinoglycan biosynthesis transport protein ExoP